CNKVVGGVAPTLTSVVVIVLVVVLVEEVEE
uniref:Uncharacterized protein n=1 Tax=Amphimedon queenslandica TaxID=400682 RepID=A0A1X7VE42_AMPQE